MIRKWSTLPAAGILALCLSGVCLAQSPAANPSADSDQPATTEDAQLQPPLPDAPSPAAAQQQTTGQPNVAQKTVQKIDNGFYFLLSSKQSRYSTTIKPGEEFVPFTVKEKFIYSLRESVSPEAFFVIFASAGYNHLIDGNPHAGSDSAGFGERVGYVALRNTSTQILSDGILGRAGSAFLTRAYYPHVSATVPVAAGTFGYSIAGELAGDLFLEFWPDVVSKLTHGKKY